ncbi:hypothetical protein HYZ41_04610 [archaeon]|nr:hypothetical protein [archaeon]
MTTDYEAWKEVVLVRLNSMPDNIEISMGSIGTLSKNDLIEHVERGDDFGQLIVEMQKKYIQSMKTMKIGFSNE